MKWIRWRGLVAFIAAVGLIAIFWFLVIDALVKRGIEKTGTALVGARVELAEADLSLFPLGLTLTGLQVTNPDSPMTNAVEAGRIAFTMDGLNLLRRKVIIDEMTVDGVRLNTPRKTSGAVKKGPGPARPPEAGPPLFTFDVPSVKDILARENLESLKVIAGLQTEVKGAKVKWRSELKDLPDRKKIDEYKARIEKLKASGKDAGGIIGGAGEALSLQDDIRKDLKRINTVKDSLQTNLRNYRKLAEDASKAPMKDIERLKNKYSLTPEGLTNLSRFFIGGRLVEWFDRSLGWYKRVEPLLKAGREKKGVEVVKHPRGRGEYVRFKEYHPMPDFLVKKALVSVSLPIGDMKGLITNITPDQDILGAPLSFAFSGERLRGLSSVKLAGVLDHIVPDRSKDTVIVDVVGLKIKEMTLSGSSEFPVVLKDGLTDFNLKAGVTGGHLDARLSAGVKSVDISAGGADAKNPLRKAISSTLSGVKRFNVTADVTGTLDKYDMKLSSDLDGVLKNSFKRVVGEEAAELEKKLRAEVAKQVEGPMKELKESLGGLEAMDGELKRLIEEETGLLNEAGKKSVPGGFKLPF